MNQNTIVNFKTDKVKGLFLSVPYYYKNFKIVRYPKAGCYLMETDSRDLNHWKINLPLGNYEIVGLSNSLTDQQIKHLGVNHSEYIRLLSSMDITVNYSDTSNFWLVIIKLN